MKTFREIANELRGTDFEFTKDNRKAYSKAIKALVSTVNGNAELSDIVKKWLNTTAKVLGDESYKLVKNDPIAYAQLLEVAAIFVENPNPRCIKMEKFDYMQLVNDQKIEELIEGHCFHLARHEDGEVVIYDTRE